MQARSVLRTPVDRLDEDELQLELQLSHPVRPGAPAWPYIEPTAMFRSVRHMQPFILFLDPSCYPLWYRLWSRWNQLKSDPKAWPYRAKL